MLDELEKAIATPSATAPGKPRRAASKDKGIPQLTAESVTCGMHVLTLQHAIPGTEHDNNDIMWALGLNMAYMSKTISKTRPHQGYSTPGFYSEIPDRTRAVMMRFMIEHPRYNILPFTPSSAELFELIQSAPGFENFSKSDLSILMGNVPSGGYRWLNQRSALSKKGDGRSKIVKQAMTLIFMHIVNKEPEERAEFLRMWIRSLIREFRARGISMAEFTQSTPAEPRRSKRGRKASSGRSEISRIWLEIDNEEAEAASTAKPA